MYVHTKNSIYKVTSIGNRFDIERVGGMPDHPNMPIGWRKVVDSIYIGIGEYACFGTVYTSTVLNVTETL